MPTKQRLQARADTDQWLNLHEAAARANYASEYLRQLMWRSPKPPPLEKYRGKWRVRPADLDAWLAERDGIAS